MRVPKIKYNQQKAIIFLIVIFALFLCGCEAEENAWNEALEEDTVRGYKKYIDDFPEGKYVQKAAGAIEEAIWLESMERDTAASYEKYLKDYQDGRYVEDALWRIAKIINTMEKYEDYLSEYPDGQHTEQAQNLLKQFSSDGNLTLMLHDLVIIDSMPGGIRNAEGLKLVNGTFENVYLFEDLLDPDEGNIYAYVDFSILNIENVGAVQLKQYTSYIINFTEKSAFFRGGFGLLLKDSAGTTYWPKIIWFREGISFPDQTNPARTYKLRLNSPIIAVFEIPEQTELSSFVFEYTYEQRDSDERLDDGQIDIELF